MIVNKKTKDKIFCKMFFLLFLLFFPFNADALTISPPTREFLGDPGKVVSSQIVVRNDEKKNLTFQITTQNFEASGEGGQPKFTDLPNDLASWISLNNKEFNLFPGASKVIPYSINIPVNATPGGHFAGILVQAKNLDIPKDGVSAQLGNQVAALILLKVSGNVIEDGKLQEFFIKDNKLKTLPIRFGVRFENLGNVFLKPYGTIRIKNWLGKQIAQLGVNDLGGNVLPKSGRRFDVIWENNDAQAGVRRIFFGKYMADLEMFYGSENKKEIVSLSFWLINRDGLIIFSGLVLIAVFIIWRIVIRMRKRRFFVERI